MIDSKHTEKVEKCLIALMEKRRSKGELTELWYGSKNSTNRSNFNDTVYTHLEKAGLTKETGKKLPDDSRRSYDYRNRDNKKVKLVTLDWDKFFRRWKRETLSRIKNSYLDDKLIESKEIDFKKIRRMLDNDGIRVQLFNFDSWAEVLDFKGKKLKDVYAPITTLSFLSLALFNLVVQHDWKLKGSEVGFTDADNTGEILGGLDFTKVPLAFQEPKHTKLVLKAMDELVQIYYLALPPRIEASIKDELRRVSGKEPKNTTQIVSIFLKSGIILKVPSEGDSQALPHSLINQINTDLAYFMWIAFLS